MNWNFYESKLFTCQHLNAVPKATHTSVSDCLATSIFSYKKQTCREPVSSRLKLNPELGGNPFEAFYCKYVALYKRS